ncbi:glycoside hydrolase family 13 protein [Zeaxanthinibacter enoshimensis]|uniref:Oligo-1,6-glucosidase n=1 Tax=Zeaxanthinibacter enoshimensis TaxID=392009 RepID=A0A4R6TNW9_9FLAO|nr:alpha-glucosidase [Zeaxanthinibacter enoshimensis]TDQ32965.1 oligo-1,6-glucosidase [Zeaxanthinibacter enoshimensis]
MKKIVLFFSLLLLILGCADNVKKKEDSITGRAWWKEGIIYQIYPRSFKDSDGDGIGDLKGVIEKLDYIESLGVNMVWMNPIYSSPNADNGYDISDYRGIMEDFGDMDDFDHMLKGLHDRGIKFVMDVVVNHSSDEHEWFKQSRSSRDNPYRDYYHWWPAEKGKPPYRYSLFDPKGDAWKYDSLTDAYYLHYFAQKQPDLNWENPKVRQEVYDIMKFWAEKGVDGFRLDAFQYASKDTTWPELPEGFEKNVIKYYGMQPNIHKYLKEMNEEVLSKYNVFAVSEGAGSTFEDAHSLVDADRKELQMAYHFEGMDVGNSLEGYKLSEFKEVYTKWDSAFAKKGWLSIFLANHDVPRMVSKFGNDSSAFRAVSSKMLNTFILTMRGTPYCYYGDELGMTNIGFDSISQYRDIAAINGYEKAKTQGADLDAYMAELKFLSRDNGRTPMQWDTTAHAGFTTGDPWLPVNENYKTVNVAVEQKDPNSCLNYFRKMVQLRRDNPVFVYGAYSLLLPGDEQLYAYTRSLGEQQVLVVLNFSDKPATAILPLGDSPQLMSNNYPELDRSASTVLLKPYQALVFNIRD